MPKTSNLYTFTKIYIYLDIFQWPTIKFKQKTPEIPKTVILCKENMFPFYLQYIEYTCRLNKKLFVIYLENI